MPRLFRTLALALCLPASLAAQPSDADKATIKFILQHQKEGSGFRPGGTLPSGAPDVPTLPATSAALRTLKLLNAPVRKELQAPIRQFVQSCYDAKSGGFASVPGGDVTVPATAQAIMAAVELDMLKEKSMETSVKYLDDSVKTFDDARIAVAALERLGASPAKKDAWIALAKKGQAADGTFETGRLQARATGSAVVALMRLGVKAERDSVLKALNAGQRKDGGFGAGKEESDLESTYRVMRCYMMLKKTPARADDLIAFIEKCRNADGGYGLSPGAASTMSATYFAVISRTWMPPK